MISSWLYFYPVLILPLLIFRYYSVTAINSETSEKHLPPQHIPFVEKKCWGYEKDCDFNESYSSSKIQCPKKSNWPNAQTKDDQIRLFWKQGDFGFIRERMEDMVYLCTSDPEDKEGSFLRCSDHLRYCYAKNIFFHFKSLKAHQHTNKYREIINDGEVGGKCTERFDKNHLIARSNHRSPLQSWAAELIPFESKDDFQMDQIHCDIIYNKPTVLIKLDASVSMYHHFCDFVNLYASQHINGSFNRDINIVLWDTSAYGYYDPTFGLLWEVFSHLPTIQLPDLDGKKVCFREAMMPLLARQRLGFYYNMPIVNGCYGSGFFHAFSHHVLHRLGIQQNGVVKRKVRVTLLSRATKYRSILNEDDLVGALKTVGEYEFRRVSYEHKMPFREQLESTHNSDIFIGMHGSGLTHLLFLPDWGGVFELYNCEDVACYRDLAALRGVNYRTWEKKSMLFQQDEGHHPTMGAHAKFTNYAFDHEEFLRIVKEMADAVKAHPAFQAEQQGLEEKEEALLNSDSTYSKPERERSNDEL